MFPRILSIGPVSVYSYGVMVFLAIIAGFAVLRITVGSAIPRKKIEDVVFFVILWGLIGARVFYFVFWDRQGFLHNPLVFFYVWQGGLAVYGGALGSCLALFFYSKKLRIPFLKLLDFFSPAFALGQAIGRIGCFLAGCCYGKPTDFFPGVKFMNPLTLAPPGVRIHPAQIYESALDFILFIFLFRMKKAKAGGVFVYYVLGYSGIRFLLEFLRGDTIEGVLGFTAMQSIAIIFIVFALVLKYAKKI